METNEEIDDGLSALAQIIKERQAPLREIMVQLTWAHLVEFFILQKQDEIQTLINILRGDTKFGRNFR